MRAAGSRVLIVGTGALAGAIGGRLARSGAAVTLAGTWPQGLQAIAARGIRVHEGDATWSVPLAVKPIDAPLGPVSLALVLVKSYRTQRAAAALAGALAPDGLAVTLQNGLGNRETLAAALGSERVGAGVALLGATVLGPGEVRFVPGRIVLGADAGRADRLARLVQLLTAAGIPAGTTGALEPVVWAKLAANCAINPLTALHRVANGALVDSPGLRSDLEAAAREVGAVAAAKGVTLEADAAEIALHVARATASNRSSMLQDVERGAPTEIDALNGALALEGRRLGVRTPVNDRLFRLVRALEGRPLASEEPLA